MKKSTLRILLFTTVLIAILGMVGCNQMNAPSKVENLRILHWNDFHSMNTVTEKVIKGDTLMVGGYAALAGYLDHYRNSAQNILVLNAGDDFQGTPISAVTKGESQIEILNAIKPDVFTIGNHEFDYTFEQLRETMKKAEFPYLLGNVVDSETGAPIYPADTIVEINNIKIGVIGVILEGLHEVTTAKATAGVKVTPVAEAVRASLKKLSPLTDIQICLSHQGVWDDSLLAMEIGSELELIVGGHSHTRLYEPKLVNGVYIVQAGAKGEFLGILDLSIDTSKDKLLSLEGKIERVISGTHPDNAEVAAIIEKQESQLGEELGRIVAELKTDWVRSYNSESNIGNFVSDAIKNAAGTDIGVINSGGIRKNLDAGSVTMRDLYEVSPFGNEIVKFKITGEELQQFALHQAGDGSFVQIGGLKYHVKAGKLVSLKVNGKPVQPLKNYTVATVNYTTDHMDRYFGLDPETHPVEYLGLVDLDVLMMAAEDARVIESHVEGRSIIEK
ncbi:bifunctional metallophosphatase/5'-nucleotidase [bacterium]|nr:bifunctional metallophosphatase/5'-nucleotidase [bacterium]